MSMKKTCLFLLILLLILPSFAFAATTEVTLEEERLRKDEITRDLEKLAPPAVAPKAALSLKFGVWVISTLRGYKDTDNNSSVEDTVSSTWLNDVRLWMMASYQQRGLLYLRVKDSYIKRKTGSGYTGIGDDNAGPSLDMGYVKLNFKPVNDMPSDVIVGRQYLYVGRGISYSNVNDGVKFTFRPKNFYIKEFFSHTLPNEDNLDTSVPNYEKEGERIFWGNEIAYTGIEDLIFYLYGLIQRDRTDKNPIPTQDYRYNSQYIGLGFETHSKKNLDYWFEAIKEDGISFTDTASVALEKKNIDAWGLDTGTRYVFDTLLHPGCELEYAWGSGDGDRSSVTDTKSGGNKFGEDENFLYFGSFFSGYALSPRLSNMRIYKLDLFLKPFEKLPLANTKDISLGFKYFVYRKDKAGGGIYDTEATLANKDVGQELDSYLYWQLSQNWYFSLRYGIFFPGKAYPSSTNDKTKFYYARLLATF